LKIEQYFHILEKNLLHGIQHFAIRLSQSPAIAIAIAF